MAFLSFPYGWPWEISRDAPPPPPVRMDGQTFARSYADVITKFLRLDELPIFLTHGASLARFLRWSSAIISQILECFIEWLQFLLWSHDWWKPRIGPDMIPNRVLKEFGPELAPLIMDIYNCSLREGYVPDLLKWAKINPLPKVSLIQEIQTDLRPISLTCTLSKVMERFACIRLVSQISEKLGPRQYAREEHSTMDTLIYILQAIHGATDSRNCGFNKLSIYLIYLITQRVSTLLELAFFNTDVAGQLFQPRWIFSNLGQFVLA